MRNLITLVAIVFTLSGSIWTILIIKSKQKTEITSAKTVYTYKTKGFVDDKHIDLWVRVVIDDNATGIMFTPKDWTIEKDEKCIELDHRNYYKTRIDINGLVGQDGRKAFIMEFNQ